MSSSQLSAQSEYDKQAKEERHANVSTKPSILKPKELPPPDLASLKVEEGFQVKRLVEGAGNTRILAFGDNGELYATRRAESDVIKYQKDANGSLNGKFDVVLGQPGVHGIAFHKGQVYLVTVHEVLTGPVLANGSFGPLKTIMRNLPDAGQHHNRTIEVGPDEMLYISVGSTCNECDEPNQENATILRGTLDGKSRSIFASGLRNTIGYDWQPQTGKLWSFDHGIDWLGDDIPEELNLIEGGKNYGWPYAYADKKVNPRLDPPAGVKKSEYVENSVGMQLGYTGHSAPMQFVFYNSSAFPKAYEGDGFATMRGSWNHSKGTGYEVVRVDFEGGKPKSIKPFVTGFLSANGEGGRLTGLTISKDGKIYFTDDRNGALYEVSYVGKDKSLATTQPVPPTEMLQQAKAKYIDNLAKDKPELATQGSFQLESSSFKNGAYIPTEHSAYDNDVAVPLRWSGAPAGTKSLVLLMEDPDVTTSPKPFLHWIVWNIPAEIKAIDRALPPRGRLKDPAGLRQGQNFSGKIGYMGPRPPEETKVHNYHFQLFALDTVLPDKMGLDRDEVIRQMKGHVLAKALLVGKFKKPEKPAKP